MLIARFNCPACETPIEAPSNSIANGIRCPQCDTGFVPEKVQTSDEAIDSSFVDGKKMKVGPRIEILSHANAGPILKAERERLEMKKQKWAEYNRLKESADNLTMIIGLSTVIAIIGVIVGGISDDASTRSVAFVISGAGFSLSLTLFLIAQLLHIRAGLEKLNNRE